MDLQLKGLNALVTGGSRGIGRAIVEALAAEGCNVAFCARSESGVNDTVTALQGAGAEIFGRAVDVGDGDGMAGFVADSATQFGGLDIVVINVSAMPGAAADRAAWEKSLEIDVMGAFNAVDPAMPYLEKSAAASIVAISSVSGVENSADRISPYCPVKAALIAYMSNLSKVLGRQGIRANTVSPGTIYFEGGVWNQVEQNAPQMYQAALDRNPFGRMGRPEEVARAAVFLASPAASFISGTNLIVDGAITNRIQF